MTVPAGITEFKAGDVLHFHCDDDHKIHLLLRKRMFAEVLIKREMPAQGSIDVALQGDTFVVTRLLPRGVDGGPDTGGDG